MSSPWTTPDARAVPSSAPYGRHVAPATRPGPPVREDVRAGLLTLAVTVLVGAPVGLLWAVLAPSVDVVVADEGVRYADPYSDGLIAVDGYFLFAVLLAGVVGGLVAWALAAQHGPAVVVALALGGAAAAYVAMVAGEQYGLEGLRTAVRAGGNGEYGGFLELNARQALAGWPVASLVSYVAATLVRGR